MTLSASNNDTSNQANTPLHSELAPQTTPSKADTLAERLDFLFEKTFTKFANDKMREGVIEQIVTEFTTTLTQHDQAVLAAIAKIRSEMVFTDKLSAKFADLLMTNVESKVTAIIKGSGK